MKKLINILRVVMAVSLVYVLWGNRDGPKEVTTATAIALMIFIGCFIFVFNYSVRRVKRVIEDKDHDSFFHRGKH